METLPELHFATSGIRGKANTTISPELGLRVGRAVSSWISKISSGINLVYVGYDNRRNSHTIANTIVAGLSSAGIDVKVFQEPVPTPLVIYSTAKSDAKAGIMVTGSHLPRDENGIILFDGSGNYFKGTLPEYEPELVSWKELGKIHNITGEIIEYRNYLVKLREQLDIKSFDWDVVVDPVHGPMKSHLEFLLKPIVSNLVKFNFEDDDEFSGRLSEPTPKHLEKTVKAVTFGKCQLGIATDMDGDRVIFITSKGEVISGDYIGAILASKYWKQDPDCKVVVPINTSAIIEYTAEKYNGAIEYCKVGPPSIINKMREIGTLYGFEETGKYFFKEHTIWPDAAVSILMVLSLLQEEETTLDAIIEKMPKLYSLKTKVPAKRHLGPQIMEKVVSEITNKFDNIVSINDMDGIRINFSDRSWLLVRPSGTEDYIRIFSEHKSEQENEKLNEFAKELVNDIIGTLQ